MLVDQTLKDLLQLCADVQDGLWEAAAHAGQEPLPALFQADAVQWNGFADRLFPLLLELDHTSPEAQWKADPNRSWMNAGASDELDDLAICDQCLRGLEQAQDRLRRAATVGEPRVRRAVIDQLNASVEQMAQLHQFVSEEDRRAV